MLGWYMHRRERHFAMLGDNRVVRPFEWGTEFITDRPNGDDPRKLFADFSARTLANSDEFFSAPPVRDHRFVTGRPGILTWTSTIETPSPENNTAYATYFPHEHNRNAAVVVLPHWNAKAGTYFDLCRFFNKVGLSSLRLTLPYHEERMPPELERAD